MHVRNVKATLKQMPLGADTTNFQSLWSILKAFCVIPVEPYQTDLPPEEQFSWEFHLGEDPANPHHFYAGFLRSMAFDNLSIIEECFCSIMMSYNSSLAQFYEPEVIEGFAAHNEKPSSSTPSSLMGFGKHF